MAWLERLSHVSKIHLQPDPGFALRVCTSVTVLVAENTMYNSNYHQNLELSKAEG